MNLKTKLTLLLSGVSTLVVTLSFIVIIAVLFGAIERQIKNQMVVKFDHVKALATPEKSVELATYLRDNDLSLYIFDSKGGEIARFGIYRSLDENALAPLREITGYTDREIASFGEYDIYSTDNIQISTRNSFVPILSSTVNISFVLILPLIFIISSLASFYSAKIILSPLTQAENISHELKTPLTRAVTSLSLIAMDSPNKLKSRIEAANRELLMLGRNVDSLLTLSLYKKQIKAKNYSDNIEGEIQRIADTVPKNIKLTASITKNIKIMVPMRFMRIILRNLFDNAVRYNKSEGFIVFRLKRAGSGWQMSVKNSVGVNKKKGYGLGMGIVREICHYQKLKFEEEKGERVYVVKISAG